MRKLNASITFRLEADLKAVLTSEAKASSMSVGELVRDWLSDQIEFSAKFPPMVEKLSGILRDIDEQSAVIARYRRGFDRSSSYPSPISESADEEEGASSGDRDDAKRRPS